MTEQHIANAETTTLQECRKQVKQVYMQESFKVTNILMDGQFNCTRRNLVELQINLNFLQR